MDTVYKVWHLQDNTYQVAQINYNSEERKWDDPSVVFQGSISDCESYIRLKENKYLN